MVTKVSESFNWSNFKLQLKNNYPIFFFSIFAYWVIYLIYKAFLKLLGTETLFASTTSQTGTFSLLFIFELPLIYLLCVLFIYFLKIMFYPDLKIKDYFYIGLKLFILDLIFLIIIAIFSNLFLAYDSTGYAILLGIVSLFSLFFMFVGYKTIIKNNIFVSFAKTFKQILKPKTIAYYLITLISIIIVVWVINELIYLGILPDLLAFLLYPLVIFCIFYFSYHSMN